MQYPRYRRKFSPPWTSCSSYCDRSKETTKTSDVACLYTYVFREEEPACCFVTSSVEIGQSLTSAFTTYYSRDRAGPERDIEKHSSKITAFFSCSSQYNTLMSCPIPRAKGKDLLTKRRLKCLSASL